MDWINQYAWIGALLFARLGAVMMIAPAWGEQCWAVAALAITAVLLNWASTGDHLLSTLGRAYWPVAGVDLALLASAALAVLAARRLGRRARLVSSNPLAEAVHA